ncbi:MAG: class II aldolase/adducin family protein [Elusimicrobiota bacterium]
MNAARRELVRLCRGFGSDLLLVQGGGGNISVKVSADELLIKASGLRLAEVNVRRGWARADAALLRADLRRIVRLKTWAGRDRAYADLLTRAGRTPGWRVSMEAGFHALLPDRCVAHIHSLAGFLLGLLPEKEAGRRIRRALGSEVDVYFVPACAPGADLTLRMRGRRAAARPCVWMLKNHGVVWGAPSAAVVEKLSARFERAFRKAYVLKRYAPPKIKRLGRGWHELSLRHWPDCSFDLRPLFPDFVVYFSLWGRGRKDLIKDSARSVRVYAKDDNNLRAKSETFFAHALVSTVAPWLGLRLRRLSGPVVRAIAGLETERLRVKQAAAK